MCEEIKSLKNNKTWALVEKPEDHKLVDCKWLYKMKPSLKGDDKPRFKARLVTKGYTQQYSIDYTEIFSPVVTYTSIRVMLSLVAQFDLKLEQMDVTTAFLHGELEDEI